jgi:uncharacterized membrane protein YsdA (DUF1294 family)
MMGHVHAIILRQAVEKKLAAVGVQRGSETRLARGAVLGGVPGSLSAHESDPRKGEDRRDENQRAAAS